MCFDWFWVQAKTGFPPPQVGRKSACKIKEQEVEMLIKVNEQESLNNSALTPLGRIGGNFWFWEAPTDSHFMT